MREIRKLMQHIPKYFTLILSRIFAQFNQFEYFLIFIHLIHFYAHPPLHLQRSVDARLSLWYLQSFLQPLTGSQLQAISSLHAFDASGNDVQTCTS